MSAIQKRSPAHPFTLCNHLFIGIKRRSVESQDISGVLGNAVILTSTKNNAWNARGNVTLSFEGYDSDPRELWEIREVRAYVKKLTDAWPNWMYFIDNSMHSLVATYLCLVEVRRTTDPNKVDVGTGCAEVLTRGFEGINDLCEQYDFPEEICEEVTQRVAIALGMKLDDGLCIEKPETTTDGGEA